MPVRRKPRVAARARDPAADDRAQPAEPPDVRDGRLSRVLLRRRRDRAAREPVSRRAVARLRARRPGRPRSRRSCGPSRCPRRCRRTRSRCSCRSALLPFPVAALLYGLLLIAAMTAATALYARVTGAPSVRAERRVRRDHGDGDVLRRPARAAGVSRAGRRGAVRAPRALGAPPARAPSPRASSRTSRCPRSSACSSRCRARALPIVVSGAALGAVGRARGRVADRASRTCATSCPRTRLRTRSSGSSA